MDQKTLNYLIKQENPYAKLSIVGIEGIEDEEAIWKTDNDFLDFLGECFSTAQFGKKSPPEFKTLASSARALSGGAQLSVKSRLQSLVPPVPFAFNRLGSENLKTLAATLRRILEDAKVLDASEE